MNNTSENVEREIDIREIFFRILYSWRFIVLSAIILAVLLGCYKYVKSIPELKNDDIQVETYKNEMKLYEENKSKIQKEIDSLNLNLQRQKEYNKNSVLMQIDTYNKHVASLNYYIKANYDLTSPNINLEKGILNSYFEITQNGDLYNYVIDNLSYDIELKYLKETIEVIPDFESNMLFIKVIGSDENQCKEIISLIQECLKKEYENISNVIGKHEITLLENAEETVVDFDLQKTQDSNLEKVNNLNNSLIVKQTALNNLIVPQSILTTVYKSIVKYSIYGFALGVFMSVMLLLVKIMASDKIYNSKQLRNNFNLRILGTLPNKKRRRLFGFVDNWLNKAEGFKFYNIDENEEINRIVANLKVDLKSDNKIHKVLFTGSTRLEKIETVYKKINSKIVNDNCLAEYGENINYNSKTVMMIENCSEVVLIEELKTSTYSEICNEISNINGLGKKVLGVILI